MGSLLFLAFAFLIVGPILGLIALVLVSRANTRIQTLGLEMSRTRREMRRLAERVGAFERQNGAAQDVDTTETAPEVPPAVRPLVQPVVQPPKESPAVVSHPPVAEPGAVSSEPKPIPGRVTSTPSRPAAPASSGIEWERWVGIRGAAVLGALALGLAGLLFFQYSIEHGLISPAVRVALGTLTGIGCLVGSIVLRKRDYAYTADGVAGAGVVILYAAFWAAHVLYSLIPMLVAFGLMALVTATCCWLATRHRSLLIAAAGLIGGFATPLLLSSGSDRPIGLFAYVLLLDCGLLLVARSRRWPSLGLASLAGTALMEVLWIGGRMGPDRLFLGMSILAVFAALFAVAGRMAGDDSDRGPWLWTRLGAIGLPFLFAMDFATRVDLGPHLYPVGILLVLLGAAAAYMARDLKQYHVGSAAAAACIAVVGSWLFRHELTPSLAWETVAVMGGLAVVFHLFCEVEPKRSLTAGPATAALLTSGGFFALLLLTAIGETGPIWPLIGGFTALAALTYRHAALPGRGWLQPCAAAAWGVGLTSLHLWVWSPLVSPTIFLTLLVLAAAGLFFVANVRRQDLRRSGMHAAAAFAAIVLTGLPFGFIRVLTPLPALGVAVLLGGVVAAAATWLRRGEWYAAAVGCTLIAQAGWMAVRPGLLQNTALTTTTFFLALATVGALTVWPLSTAERFKSQPAAWRAAALAGPLWFVPLWSTFDAAWGDKLIGLLPVALGALTLAGAWYTRKLRGLDDHVSRCALVWFAAMTACLFALAIPVQFDKQWITVGWALQGFALTGLWKRLDHPGLKYFGLALLGAATLRLIANPALLLHFYEYPRSGVPILNWLLYTYLVPAAALLGSAAMLRPLEATRARAWERGLYARGYAVGAVSAGFAAVAVVFVWINLAIADVFATGTRMALDLGGDPAQRLTVSIAWAIYAVVLLMLGMARKSIGLRWLSLGFLMITIGKVFLYDLGKLQDLYRVGSLVGLAASLILVSLLYQRFVFKRAS